MMVLCKGNVSFIKKCALWDVFFTKSIKHNTFSKNTNSQYMITKNKKGKTTTNIMPNYALNKEYKTRNSQHQTHWCALLCVTTRDRDEASRIFKPS